MSQFDRDVLSAAQVPNPGMTVTPSKGSAGKCSCITPKQGRLGSKNVPVRGKCGKLAEVQMKYFFFFFKRNPKHQEAHKEHPAGLTQHTPGALNKMD